MSAVVNGGGAVINGASGGGASLPGTPASVLLDAGSADEVVALSGLGVGTTKTYAEVVLNGLSSVTEFAAEGDFPVGDGAGGTQLASVDPAAVRTALELPPLRGMIPLFAYATSGSAVAEVVGLAGFTPADYAVSGRTTTLTLDAIGSVTGAGLTATLELLNAAGTTVATLTWTETTATRKTTSVTLPGSAEIWRARVSCTGVVNPLTDYALIGGAHVRINWS